MIIEKYLSLTIKIRAAIKLSTEMTNLKSLLLNLFAFHSANSSCNLMEL